MTREKQLELAIDSIRIWLSMQHSKEEPYINILNGIRSVLAWLDDPRTIEED